MDYIAEAIPRILEREKSDEVFTSDEIQVMNGEFRLRMATGEATMVDPETIAGRVVIVTLHENFVKLVKDCLMTSIIMIWNGWSNEYQSYSRNRFYVGFCERMKRLEGIETDLVSLKVGECDCGYHFSVDATFLEQVRDFTFRCPSCNKIIDTAIVFPEGES